MARPTKSKPPENLIGRRFGRLTVVSFSKKEKGRLYWLALCDCDNRLVEVRDDHLKSGHTRSCGCLSLENPGMELQKDRVLKVKRDEYRLIKKRHREKSFSDPDLLLFDDFSRLVDQPCFYCSQTGSKRVKDRSTAAVVAINGLDRLKNDRGYTKQNSISCCRTCNEMKRNLSILEFAKWVTQVYKYWVMEEVVSLSPIKVSSRSSWVKHGNKVKKYDRRIVHLEAYYRSLKYDAKKMHRKFLISLDEFVELISQSCTFCGANYSKILDEKATGFLLKVNTIDRVDSRLPYIPENLQTACLMCNLAKKDRSNEEVKEHIIKLYNSLPDWYASDFRAQKG